MRIIITDMKGHSVEEAVHERLHGILSRLDTSGKQMQDGMIQSVRSNFQMIYPGSKHYDPQKVQPLSKTDGSRPEAVVSIDVPGVTRAYHNMNILPKLRNHLAIPMNALSKDKKPMDFDNTIFVRKRSGKEFIAQKVKNGLVFLFYLARSAFQKKDPKLMPSDETLADSAFSRITAYLASAK